MARWVAIFEDSDGMLAVRQQREPAHLAYLETYKDKILIAGGLRAGRKVRRRPVGAGGGKP
jgi:hypothetical protein